MAERQARPRPSLESLFIGTLALAGFAVSARPIGDNSMFVHLRTGIDIAAGRGIPRRDPYSFTAVGEQWVVQSWLPEAIYGWGHRLAGYGAVVLEQAVLTGLLAWLIGRLARTGSAVRTLAAGFVAFGVGVAYWSPRPLLFGLVCLALAVLVVERRARVWWLVPVVWLWVNSHGSFPLGLAWLAAVVVGEWLDDRRRRPASLPYLGAFVVGLVVACINPLGPRLLTFALNVGEKRDAFRAIREWKSPDFQTGEGLFSLVFLVLAVVIVARSRVSWRDVLPFAGFAFLALLTLRNLPALSVVLAPVLGRALTPAGADVEPRPENARLNRMVAGVLAAAALLLGVSAASGRQIDDRAYPVAALRWMTQQGLFEPPHRVAEQDGVGCYLILRRGTEARVFYDDRVDMYPLAMSRDYADLHNGAPNALAILDRRRIDVVLWETARPLSTVLSADPDWRRVYRRGEFSVFQRGPR